VKFDIPEPEKSNTAIGDDLPMNLLEGEFNEENMRLEFRKALDNWREDPIDEREEYPNEDEGCGVSTSIAPSKATTKQMNTVDTQASTDPTSNVQMVTTNIQHRGNDVNEAESYGPIEPTKIKPSEYKPPKKVSCWNCYRIGIEPKYEYDALTKNYFCDAN
jgi:hypothetical protein